MTRLLPWIPPSLVIVGLCVLLTAADSDMPWLVIPAFLLMWAGWRKLPVEVEPW